MFQQEVAERICAVPGTAAYGRLSVLTQWTCGTELLLRIAPSAFVPAPKVFSAVVGLVPHAAQPAPTLFAAMERLTAAAFGQRRKMLRGALRTIGGEALLRDVGIAPDRRAETLSVEEFDRLARQSRVLRGTGLSFLPATTAPAAAYHAPTGTPSRWHGARASACPSAGRSSSRSCGAGSRRALRGPTMPLVASGSLAGKLSFTT